MCEEAKMLKEKRIDAIISLLSTTDNSEKVELNMLILNIDLYFKIHRCKICK